MAQAPLPVLDEALAVLVAIDPVEELPLAVVVPEEPLPPALPLFAVLPPIDVDIDVPVVDPPPLPPALPLLVHPTTTSDTASTAELQEGFIVPAAFATRVPRAFRADQLRDVWERVLEDSTISPTGSSEPRIA